MTDLSSHQLSYLFFSCSTVSHFSELSVVLTCSLQGPELSLLPNLDSVHLPGATLPNLASRTPLLRKVMRESSAWALQRGQRSSSALLSFRRSVEGSGEQRCSAPSQMQATGEMILGLFCGGWICVTCLPHLPPSLLLSSGDPGTAESLVRCECSAPSGSRPNCSTSLLP